MADEAEEEVDEEEEAAAAGPGRGVEEESGAAGKERMLAGVEADGWARSLGPGEEHTGACCWEGVTTLVVMGALPAVEEETKHMNNCLFIFL